jgi:hypothetical protein
MKEVHDNVAEQSESSAPLCTRRGFLEFSIAAVTLYGAQRVMGSEADEQTEAVMQTAVTDILKKHDTLFMDWEGDHRAHDRERVSILLKQALKLTENQRITLIVEYVFKEKVMKIMIHDSDSPLNVCASFNRKRLYPLDAPVHDFMLHPTLSDLTQHQLNLCCRAHFRLSEKIGRRPTISSMRNTENGRITIVVTDTQSMMVIGQIVCDEDGQTIHETILNEDVMQMLTAGKAAE